MNRVQSQNKGLILSLSSLSIGVFALSTASFAKTGGSSSVQYHLKKKTPATKNRAPEIYSALETDEGNPISTSLERADKKKNIQASPVKLSQSPKDSPKDYDDVPEQLYSPLVRRLQLVQILIQKYNRAYDYRSHTTAELERILMSLNSKQQQSTQRPAQQEISMAPIVDTIKSADGDAEKSSDPLFSGNVEDESVLETLPDLPPPNPA